MAKKRGYGSKQKELASTENSFACVCEVREGGRSEISKTKRRSGLTCTRLSTNKGLKDKQKALHRKRGA